jgi:hypothetical protein
MREKGKETLMTVSPALITAIKRSPLAVLILALVSLLAAGIIAFYCFSELQSLGDAPLKLTLEQVRQKAAAVWVDLQGVVLTDENIYFKDRNRWEYDVLYKDKRQDLFAVITYFHDEEITNLEDLDAEPKIGVISQINDTRYAVLKTNGLVLPENDGRLFSLCTYCGKANAQYGLIAALFFLVLGLPLLIIAVRLRVKNKSWKQIQT